MPNVTIRYWAAAREAAGVAEEQIDADTLAQALERAVAAHGERLAHVLRRCSFVVDEAPAGVRPHAGVPVGEGSVVEVLPPFAGGATDAVIAPTGRPLWRPEPGGIVVAVATIAVGAALAGASWGGRGALTVVLALAQCGLVAAWFAVAGGRARVAGGLVSLAVLVGADAALFAHDGGRLAIARASSLGPLAVAMACGLLALIAVQLFRGATRTELTASLAVGAAAIVLVGMSSAFVALRSAPAGRDLAVVAFVALAAAALASLTPGAPWAGPVAAIALGAGAGALAATLLGSGLDVSTGAVVGAAAGLLSGCGRLAAARLTPQATTRVVTMALAITAPLAFVAPVALVVGRVMTG